MEYLGSLQVFAAVYVIFCVGYFCAFLKLFAFRDCSAIRRLLYLAGIPGLMFDLVGHIKPNKSSAMPIVNALLTQVTIHIIIGIAAACIRSERKLLNYLRFYTEMTSPALILVGYPVLQILFGSDFMYVSAVTSIIHFLVIDPAMKVIAIKVIGTDCAEDKHSEEGVNEIGYEEIDNTGTGSSRAPVIAPDDVIKERLLTGDEKKETPTRLWRTVLFLFLTPINVAFLLGVIWSLTPWEMLKFMSSFAYDLERSVIASGCFIVGVFMWEHKFFGGKWLEIAISVLCHCVVLPCISALWSYLLQIDNKMAQALVMIHATPMSLSALFSAESFGLHGDSPTYTFFWSNLLSLPVLMLWVVVFNQTGLFPLVN